MIQFYDDDHKARYIMTIRKEIDMKKPLTDEQKQMLEALKTRPITPDDSAGILLAEMFLREC